MSRRAFSASAVAAALVAMMGVSMILGRGDTDQGILIVAFGPPKIVAPEVAHTPNRSSPPATAVSSVPQKVTSTSSTSTSPPTSAPFVLDLSGIDVEELLVASEQEPVPPQKPVVSAPRVEPPPAIVAPAVIDLRTPEGGPITWTGSGDAADPFIVRRGEDYFAFTTNTSGANIPVWYSNDLKSWTLLVDALPDLPSWAAPNTSQTWAPSVLQRGGQFVLYFTTRDAVTNRQCIGVATSADPQGPYESVADRPLVCQVGLGGSIDPSPFVDASGTPWLLWKNDGNCCEVLTRIWSQRLSVDGTSLVGSEAELLWADQKWEASLIEGPAMVEVNGKLHLFYSANQWSSNRYAIGHAVCDTVQGPCYKSTAGPWVGGDGGPGGAEFFSDSKGRVWMVFHEWRYRIGYPGGERSMYIRPVQFPGAAPPQTAPTTIAPGTTLVAETTVPPSTTLIVTTSVAATTIPETASTSTAPPTTSPPPPTTAISSETTTPPTTTLGS